VLNVQRAIMIAKGGQMAAFLFQASGKTSTAGEVPPDLSMGLRCMDLH